MENNYRCKTIHNFLESKNINLIDKDINVSKEKKDKFFIIFILFLLLILFVFVSLLALYSHEYDLLFLTPFILLPMLVLLDALKSNPIDYEGIINRNHPSFFVDMENIFTTDKEIFRSKIIYLSEDQITTDKEIKEGFRILSRDKKAKRIILDLLEQDSQEMPDFLRIKEINRYIVKTMKKDNFW